MARRFQFRLETVLKIRQRRRDAVRRVVADRLRAVEAVRSSIAALTGGIDDNHRAVRDVRKAAGLTIDQLRGQAIYQAYLQRSLGAANAELNRRRGELRTEQRRLAEAATRLKVIEKLRERAWAAHRASLAREELRIHDEAAQHLFHRARSGAVGS